MSKYRVILETKAIAHKWWGQMWCQNIDNYADFTNRLERGRAYIRSGRVHDIMIEKGMITAKVDGSMDEPYDVQIKIDPLPEAVKDRLLRKIVNLNAFKDGYVPDDYKFLFSVDQGGLFPRENELVLCCTCPDVAVMCKHIAAVLYAVGSIIDQEPLLLFQLRDVDVEAYLDADIREKTNQLLVSAKNFDDNSRLIEDDLISEFFGIELADLHVPEHSYNVEEASPVSSPEVRTIIIGRAPKKPRQQPVKVPKPISPDRMVIRQYGLNGKYIDQFENYDEASGKTGIAKRVMQRNVCGEKKSGGGFVWRKVPANSVCTDIEPLSYDADPQKKAVCQYEYNGILVAEYDSISEAARESGINLQSIRHALNGLQKQAGGFVWTYKETTAVAEEARLTEEIKGSNVENVAEQMNACTIKDAGREQDEAQVPIQPVEDEFEAIVIPIGEDSQGGILVQNMAFIPHMLIAGCSESGKTAFIETVLSQMASAYSPERIQYVIYSSKASDYLVFKDLPHLVVPVIFDYRCLYGALQWVNVEMYRRLRAFSGKNAKDLEGYNKRSEQPLAHIFVIVDDYYELIRNGDYSIIETIKSILTNGRQAGIHLVVATSMPSAKALQKDVLSGFPCRACFAVANKADSRLILDQNSAVDLESPGEMIFKTLTSSQRCHASYMTDDKLAEVTSVIKNKFKNDINAFGDNPPYPFIERFGAKTYNNSRVVNETSPTDVDGKYDEFLPQAVEAVLEMKFCSVSMLQRRVKLGYSRAARLVDQMEELGIVGPYEGAKPRTVLIDWIGWEQLKGKLGYSKASTSSGLEIKSEPEAVANRDLSVEKDSTMLEPDDNECGMEDTVPVLSFPRFDVGNASFDIHDGQVHMSKVAQLHNCSGAVSMFFDVDFIKEIVVKRPRLFSKGYIQFVLEENITPEIKGLSITDLDRTDSIELAKTIFSRNQTEIILSFTDFISDNWNVKKTIL